MEAMVLDLESSLLEMFNVSDEISMIFFATNDRTYVN